MSSENEDRTSEKGQHILDWTKLHILRSDWPLGEILDC